MADREEKVFLARLAEQAERYEDMVKHMEEIAKLDVGLTPEERNLLSVAYKNVIGLRRSSWRTIKHLEQKHENDEESEKKSLIIEYRIEIDAEMQKICNDIVELLDTHLIPSVNDGGSLAESTEAYVFYCKMKGDYLRYVAEFTTGDERNHTAEDALLVYKTATEAADNLLATNPVKLGLALNFSVFCYEILNSPERACRMAQVAFDGALVVCDQLNGDKLKDCNLIMQLLRDNIALWTQDGADKSEDEDETRLEEVEDEE